VRAASATLSPSAGAGATRPGTSLRTQLLRPLLWIWLVGGTLAVIGAFELARDSVNDAFDRGLQDQASALAARVQWSEQGPLLDVGAQAARAMGWDQEDRLAFAMQDTAGSMLAGDELVPVPAPAQRERAYAAPVLFDGRFRGRPVRGAVYSLRSPGLEHSVSIVVIETGPKRALLLRRLLLSVLLPGLGFALVSVVLIAWGVRRGLQPLEDIARDVAERDPADWSALPLDRVPAEAVPLIERINGLLADMREAAQRQRRFVADAAHQLRTPVAGLQVLAQQLQAELAGEGATDGGRCAPLLSQMTASTRRMNRLIGQLLSLARSETALGVDGEQASLDIVPLLREAAEPVVLQALREGRSVEFDAPDVPVPARAHPLWLAEAVTNLLDNARRYGGPHVLLRVRALSTGGAEVVVEDDGPGVPAEQLPRLFEPFWRGERADLRNDGGTGLGLTIAREIVERLGGQIEALTRPDVPGLRFTLRLAA